MRNSQVYRTPHVVALTLAQAREWGATGANCCQFRSRVSRQLSAFKAAAFAGRFGQLVKCSRIGRRFFVQRERHRAAETRPARALPEPVKPPSAPVTLESRLLFSWRPTPSSSSSIARLPHVVSSPVSGTSGAATIPPLRRPSRPSCEPWDSPRIPPRNRSEEHTSELQSLRHLVCRL